MRLPSAQTKVWNQSNREGPSRVENGRIVGTLRGSYGLDMQSKLGRVGLRGMVLTTDTVDDADFSDTPVGFKYFNSDIYTVAGSYVWKNSGVLNGNFTQDTATGTPTTCDENSDIELFFDSASNTVGLYVTASVDDVYYTTNGTSWSTFDVGVGFGDETCLCYYANRMYSTYANNYIISWNISNVVATAGAANTIKLPSSDQVTFIKAGSNRIWIGTMNKYNEGARVYEWDGASPQATKVYTLEAVGALSCVVKNDIPYIVDTNGRLLKWNNTAFVEVARLPVDNRYLFQATSQSNPARFIHRNGMSIVANRIVMLINNNVEDNTNSILEYCPSGIWEYDEEMGLYHKHALSYTKDNLTITDFGQNRIGRAGGVASLKIENDASNARGTFICGARYYTDATTLSTGIWIDDTRNTKTNTGYIVTEVDSGGIQDTFSKAFLKFRPLLNSTDKIVFKYRKSLHAAPTEITITWTSTTTFTTTDANMANYAVGDEVEITRGKGGGMCSHITVISLNAGTYTVTVDETHTGATSGTASARLQKWIKSSSITADTASDFLECGMGNPNANSGLVLLKIFFYWKGDNEFQFVDLVNGAFKKAE